MERSAYFYSAVFLVCWLAAFYITRFTATPVAGSNPAFVLRLALLTAGMLALSVALGKMHKSKAADRAKNYFVTGYTVVLLFFLLESTFMFIPYSHGSGATLGSCTWFRRYWHANKLGYRDKEIDLALCGNKKKILVTGDSFVAGHGIENPDDRFTGVLEKLLRGGYCVFNAGRNGADTRSSYNQLISFPIRPDLMIVCHTTNDIETLSLQLKSHLQHLSPGKNYAGSSMIIKNSYFLEYASLKLSAIWKGLKKRKAVTTKEYYMTGEGKKNYLARYLEEPVMRQHLEDLYRFVKLSETEKVPLIVVLFPETWSAVIDYSEEFVNRPIIEFLKKYNVPVLDTYEIMKKFPERERVVNWSDAHPSVEVHKEIGLELGRMIAEQIRFMTRSHIMESYQQNK